MSTLGIPNESQLEDGLRVGGAVSPEALDRAKAVGVTTIINLRMPQEPGVAEEKSRAEALDLGYISIPISGPDDLTKENASKLDEAIRSAGPDKALVHCGSSNRVGALLAIRAAEVQGLEAKDALALGKRAGLKDLEGATAKRLGL